MIQVLEFRMVGKEDGLGHDNLIVSRFAHVIENTKEMMSGMCEGCVLGSCRRRRGRPRLNVTVPRRHKGIGLVSDDADDDDDDNNQIPIVS